MVKTRNQRAQTPNAVQLVSIPTVYRPSTRNGRWIVESMPGTSPQSINGESIRVTRTGIHLTPTPRSSRQPTPATHGRSRATKASCDGGASDEVAREGRSSNELSDAAAEVVEELLVEASGQPGPSPDQSGVRLDDPADQLAVGIIERSPSGGLSAVGLDDASQQSHEAATGTPDVPVEPQEQTSFEATIGPFVANTEREFIGRVQQDNPEHGTTLPSPRAGDRSSVAWGEFMGK